MCLFFEFRNKFGEFFHRAVVLGFLKYPDNILVVNTAVLLEPDKDNFYYLLDMWNAQVNNCWFRFNYQLTNSLGCILQARPAEIYRRQLLYQGTEICNTKVNMRGLDKLRELGSQFPQSSEFPPGTFQREGKVLGVPNSVCKH